LDKRDNLKVFKCADSLDQLNLSITFCKKCSSMNNGQKRVTGIGSCDPKVFFIGEAPGRLGADQTGVPFTQDRSGKLLREMLNEINLPSHEVYISNILKCNPRSSNGKNRTPSEDELANCSEYLLQELIIIRPTILVPLGKLASSIFLGSDLSMAEVNAKIFCHSNYGKVFPLFHPSYVVRGFYPLTKYRQDFHKLEDLVGVQ